MTTTLTAPTIPAPWAPRLRQMRYEPQPGEADPPPGIPSSTAACVIDPKEPPGAPEPDPAGVHRMLTEVLRIAMEVLDGRRPLSQLAPHLAPSAQRYWRAALRQRRPQGAAKITRVRLCLPRHDAAEIAAVCVIDGRVRALAARFEQETLTARWRCASLRLM